MIEENNDDNIQITNLIYKEEEIGNLFKQSKAIFTWKFTLDGIRRAIILEHSRLTGKRVVIYDKKELVRNSKYTYNFRHSFPIDRHNIDIYQSGTSYEMKIDGINYQKLLNQQKLQRYNIIREEYILEHPFEEEKKHNPDDDLQFFDGNGNLIVLPEDPILRQQMIAHYKNTIAMQEMEEKQRQLQQMQMMQNNDLINEGDEKEEMNEDDNENNEGNNTGQREELEEDEKTIKNDSQRHHIMQNMQGENVDLLNLGESINSNNDDLIELPIQVPVQIPQNINNVNENLNIGDLQNFQFQ